jgi:hypothetical protein
MSTIRDITHSTYWYVWCLDWAGGAMYPGGHVFWLIHLNWGRIKNTKPRKNPERNPPIWAKLSTCGRSPTARFTAMMQRRVNSAANCTQKSASVRQLGYIYSELKTEKLQGNRFLFEAVKCTLFAYMVQLVISSESMPPSKPKSAPEAPTEIPVWINKADNKLPPKPDMT